MCRTYDSVVQLYQATVLLHATVHHVATAANRITNMASSDSDDDIPATNVVLLSSFPNQKLMLSLGAQKCGNSFKMCVVSSGRRVVEGEVA